MKTLRAQYVRGRLVHLVACEMHKIEARDLENHVSDHDLEGSMHG